MTLSVFTRYHLGSFELDASCTPKGGVPALFGRFCSGKTSIIRVIASLSRLDEEQVTLDVWSIGR